jgi:hypothetical protein
MNNDPGAARGQDELATRYAEMSDGELEKVAQDFTSLTDQARSALSAELAKRGLPVPAAAQASSGDEIDIQNLVTICKFRDLPEALLAKGSLESSGIECFLVDDNMVRLEWFFTYLIGGVKLQVQAEDAEAANQILDEPIPDEFDVEGVGAYSQPTCPKCQSLDVSFEELNKPVAYTSALLRVPMPVHNKGWKCQSCGHQWEDSSAQ